MIITIHWLLVALAAILLAAATLGSGEFTVFGVKIHTFPAGVLFAFLSTLI